MENIFKNILNDNLINPPDQILNHFNEHFKNAINVEWFNDNEFYEAIFYENECEKIVKYGLQNNFINLKSNINPENLPELIIKKASAYGEIMNSIIIENNHKINFEIIYRDSELARYLLFLDETGVEIKKQKL